MSQTSAHVSLREAPDGSTAPVRVLICENDPTMASSLQELIVDTPGMTLAGVAGDTDTAAQLAEETQPDAAILDVRMAGGGGPRAARLIRQRVPDARLVAFSAYADRNTVLAMLRAGVDEYLVKGVDDVDLIEALRRSGRGRISLPPIDMEELLIEVVEMLRVAEADRDSARALLAERQGAVP
jgi:DNA-binding NarL/FixJ family response regulator